MMEGTQGKYKLVKLNSKITKNETNLFLKHKNYKQNQQKKLTMTVLCIATK